MPDDEDREMMSDEECPGPSELDSALVSETLADVATPPPLVLSSSTSLADTIAQMRKDRRACVLLVDGSQLTGIFTERDVLMKVAGSDFDLARTPVAAVMTRDPMTLPADSSVAYALNKMVLEGFRHIPVTDRDGRAITVISMRNLIEYLSEFFARDVLNLPPEPHMATYRSRDGG